VDEQADDLIIFPPETITPAKIATYDDHRMAMAFALVGLKAERVTILDPGCVAKTYPGFWNDLAKLSQSE
jgi:3-phosphoshikimate 1-carboxyvinyltransferase